MERRCSVCNEVFTHKEMKSICHKNYCNECYKAKKRIHRQITKDNYIYKKPVLPKINPTVDIEKKKFKQLKVQYLTNDESTLLYHKHLDEGLNPKEASECVKVIKEQLKDTIRDLNNQIDKEEITYEDAVSKKNEFMEGLHNV